jgi:hypothetical protein
MNYALLDHLEIFMSRDTGEWVNKLIKEGVANTQGEINADKLNLLTGAFVSSLLDAMREADIDINEVHERFKQLHSHGDVHAMYYLLYLIFATLEIDLPYLFLAVSANETVLAKYLDEFMLDFEDYLTDI